MDRQYFAQTHVTEGAYEMYYLHNLHFVVYARAMQGRKADALKAAAVFTDAARPMAQAMPEMVDAFMAVPWFTLLRFNQWEVMLKTPATTARSEVGHRILALCASRCAGGPQGCN